MLISVACRHLSSDHDPLFRFHRWLANLRILDVEEIKSIPYTPVSHPFVERLIGTIRREFLDHVLIWNAIDLERRLEGSIAAVCFRCQGLHNYEFATHTL
jgi:hypothetical protein